MNRSVMVGGGGHAKGMPGAGGRMSMHGGAATSRGGSYMIEGTDPYYTQRRTEGGMGKSGSTLNSPRSAN